jgi:hypothetical protein
MHCWRVACLDIIVIIASIIFSSGFRGALPSIINHCSHRRSTNFCAQTGSKMINNGDDDDNNIIIPTGKLRSLTIIADEENTTAHTSPKGTVYVTIGPQCAGKTTILKTLFGSSSGDGGGKDITIDNQELVYISVPTSNFLNQRVDSSLLLNQTIFGKTIRERILDQSNNELRYVLKRLGRFADKLEFASSLRELYNQDLPHNTIEKNKMVYGDLMYAVESIIRMHDGPTNMKPISLPNAIDLFIVESIFKPRPLKLLENTNNASNVSATSSEALSALDQARHLLNTHAIDPDIHPVTAPLSWGNTNTRGREYESALEAAAVSGRPVKFIVYGGIKACEMIQGVKYNSIHDDTEEDTSDRILCMEKVDRKTLFVRNIQRFLQTGRYVPSNAISDAIERVDLLMVEAASEAKKNYHKDTPNKPSMLCLHDAKFQLDYGLAKLAGYRLNSDRTVTQLRVNHDGSSSNTNTNHSNGRGGRNRQTPHRYKYGRGNGNRDGRSHS